MLGAQIKAAMESLNSFQPTLDHLGSARDVEMIMELGKPLSGVKYCWLTHVYIIWLKIVEFYGIKSVQLHQFHLRSGPLSFLLTLIVWLTGFQGSGPISWNNEKPCKEHGSPDQAHALLTIKSADSFLQLFYRLAHSSVVAI